MITASFSGSLSEQRRLAEAFERELRQLAAHREEADSMLHRKESVESILHDGMRQLEQAETGHRNAG